MVEIFMTFEIQPFDISMIFKHFNKFEQYFADLLQKKNGNEIENENSEIITK